MYTYGSATLPGPGASRSRQWVRADGLWGGGNTTAQGPHLYPGKAQTAAKVPGPDAASAGLGC